MGTAIMNLKSLVETTVSTVPVASDVANGLMISTDKTKLDGIESGATADQTAAEIRVLVGSATDSNVYVDADKTKVDTYLTTFNLANKLVQLDGNGYVPSANLPSYVDDVIIGADLATLEALTLEAGKVYVASDTNITYRWDGVAQGAGHLVIIGTDLALGETSVSAYRGDRGKIAYDHSQVVTGNPHGTTADDISDGATNAIITLTQETNFETAYSHVSLTNNPHSVTATQVGLGNVTNESKATMFTSAALTGVPTAPTATTGTNTTQIATTAFVVSSINTIGEW